MKQNRVLLLLPIMALLFLCIPGRMSAQDFVTGALTASGSACPTTPPRTSSSTSAVTISAIGFGGATFTIGSTAFSGTVTFYASGDGGATWQTLNATPSNSTTAVTSATAAGVFQANVSAYTNVCALATVYSSGTITVTIHESPISARAGGGGSGGSGCGTPPTSPNNLTQDCASTPSGGVGQPFVAVLPGMNNRDVTGTTSTDTILSTDCQPGSVRYQGSVAVAIDLPTTATLAVPNCVFSIRNETSPIATLTITPDGGLTINGGATATVTKNETCRVSVDNSNWKLDCSDDASIVAVINGANTFTASGTIDLSAATSATAFKPPAIAGASPGTTAAIAYDTTQECYKTGGTHLGSACADRTLFVENCTTDSNCATQAATSPGTSNGNIDTASGTNGTSKLYFTGISIPASTILTNKVVRACAVLQVTTSSSAATLVLGFNLGTTAVTITPAVAPANSLTNKGTMICATVTGTAAAGASVSVVGGWDGLLSVGTGASGPWNQTAQPVATIATNGALIASWSAQWGASTAGNSIVVEAQYFQVIN